MGGRGRRLVAAAPARVRGGRRLRHGGRRVPRGGVEHLRADARLGGAPRPALRLRPEPDHGRRPGGAAHGGPAAPGLRPGPHRRHRRPARPHHRHPPPLLGPRAELPPLALRRAAGRGEARGLPRDPAELPPRGLPAGLGRAAGRRLGVRGGGMGPVRPGRRDRVGGVGRGGIGLPHRHRRPGVARPRGRGGSTGRPGRLRPGAGGAREAGGGRPPERRDPPRAGLDERPRVAAGLCTARSTWLLLRPPGALLAPAGGARPRRALPRDHDHPRPLRAAQPPHPGRARRVAEVHEHPRRGAEHGGQGLGPRGAGAPAMDGPHPPGRGARDHRHLRGGALHVREQLPRGPAVRALRDHHARLPGDDEPLLARRTAQDVLRERDALVPDRAGGPRGASRARGWTAPGRRAAGAGGAGAGADGAPA